MTAVETPKDNVIRYAWSADQGSWLFVQDERVDYLTAIHHAIRTAKTWRQFWNLLPNYERDNLKDQLKWLASDAAADGDRENARRYRPKLADPFESGVLPGVGDGDYPPILNRDEVKWIPKDIVQRFGASDSSFSGGTFILFTQDDPNELLSAFAEHGFNCIHDEMSVLRAAGWRPHPSQPWQE